MSKHYYPGKNILEGVKLDLYTEDSLRSIDYATMEVLQNPGIQVSDDEALQIFKNAGCEVNEKTRMVKIPEHIVRRALSTAPSRFELYGREKKNKLVQEHKGKVHWTCFGTGIQVCNYKGPGQYETVDSTDKDLATVAKLVDWADNVDYFSLAVSARDWAGKGKEDVHEMYTSVTNTTKHFHHIDPVGENVEYYFELAKAIYGGNEEEARKKPLMSMLVCPTSPLELSSNACQVIIKGARLGIPTNVLSMAMSGGSAPIYLAGTLVTHNAEVLAGIVLSQLAVPGAKVWYGSSTTTFDIKRGTAPVGSPELGMISASVAKLGQYYGLPTFVAGIQADAKVPDVQAGHEKTITTILPALSGANTIYGAGMLELGMTFSMEQLVIDNDIISMVKKVMQGIPVNEETLAVEAIQKVGVGNNFLSHKTTMANIDLPSDPQIINRDMLGDWVNAGRKSLDVVAHEKVLQILADHVVSPIDADILKDMNAIVEKGDKAFRGQL